MISDAFTEGVLRAHHPYDIFSSLDHNEGLMNDFGNYADGMAGSLPEADLWYAPSSLPGPGGYGPQNPSYAFDLADSTDDTGGTGHQYLGLDNDMEVEMAVSKRGLAREFLA